jgi:hypothetical protein
MIVPYMPLYIVAQRSFCSVRLTTLPLPAPVNLWHATSLTSLAANSNSQTNLPPPSSILVYCPHIMASMLNSHPHTLVSPAPPTSHAFSRHTGGTHQDQKNQSHHLTPLPCLLTQLTFCMIVTRAQPRVLLHIIASKFSMVSPTVPFLVNSCMRM